MSIQFASDETNRWPSALCAQTDPDTWFPEKGGSHKDAVKICRRCVYFENDTCLEDALADPTSMGIRAGTTERERSRILRDRRMAAR